MPAMAPVRWAVSAIKMCRSVMIKGLEALTTECLFAAREYGVEEEVLSSLHHSFPSGLDRRVPRLSDQPGGGTWHSAQRRDGRGGENPA